MNALKVLVAASAHPWNTEAVEKLDEYLKCDVTLVSSVEEARRKEADGGYDVVFVDCKLDPEKGLALARKIKQTRGHHTVVFYATDNFKLDHGPVILIDRDPWHLNIELKANVTKFFGHRMAS